MLVVDPLALPELLLPAKVPVAALDPLELPESLLLEFPNDPWPVPVPEPLRVELPALKPPSALPVFDPEEEQDAMSAMASRGREPSIERWRELFESVHIGVIRGVLGLKAGHATFSCVEGRLPEAESVSDFRSRDWRLGGR